MADTVKTKVLAEVKNDGKVYYWRVKLKDDNAAWSSISKFTTIGSIAPATISYPKLYKNVPPVINENSGAYYFSWRNKSGTAYNTLEFYNAEKQDNTWKCVGDPLIKNKVAVKGERMYTKILELYNLNDGNYCIKVISYNSAGATNTSEPGFFTYKMFNPDASLTPDPLFAQASFSKLILYWSKLLPSNLSAENYDLRISTSPKMETGLRIDVKEVKNNYYVTEKGSEAWGFVKENTGKDLYWQVGINNVWSRVARFRSKL
jgi:hypothetical protein